MDISPRTQKSGRCMKTCLVSIIFKEMQSETVSWLGICFTYQTDQNKIEGY